jgi:hypothetical protein
VAPHGIGSRRSRPGEGSSPLNLPAQLAVLLRGSCLHNVRVKSFFCDGSATPPYAMAAVRCDGRPSMLFAAGVCMAHNSQQWCDPQLSSDVSCTLAAARNWGRGVTPKQADQSLRPHLLCPAIWDGTHCYWGLVFGVKGSEFTVLDDPFMCCRCPKGQHSQLHRAQRLHSFRHGWGGQSGVKRLLCVSGACSAVGM